MVGSAHAGSVGPIDEPAVLGLPFVLRSTVTSEACDPAVPAMEIGGPLPRQPLM